MKPGCLHLVICALNEVAQLYFQHQVQTRLKFRSLRSKQLFWLSNLQIPVQSETVGLTFKNYTVFIDSRWHQQSMKSGTKPFWIWTLLFMSLEAGLVCLNSDWFCFTFMTCLWSKHMHCSKCYFCSTKALHFLGCTLKLKTLDHSFWSGTISWK